MCEQSASRKQKLSLNETAKKGSKEDVKLQQKRHQLPENLENCLAFFPPQEPPYLCWFFNHISLTKKLHPSCWQRPRSARSDLVRVWGVPPFFVSKALEPKSVGGFNQGFQLARRVRFERIWSTPSRGSWMGIIFFHTLLWCLWRDSKKRTQWWCETRLHFWLSLYSKLVINSNWK